MAEKTTEQKMQEIEHAWGQIKPALVAYDGSRAFRLMDALYDDNFQIWNACYWRTERWLKSWFRGRFSHKWTDGEDHSGGEWVEFVRRCYPDRLDGRWSANELPYLLQQLKAEDKTTKQVTTHQEPF